MKLWLDSDFFKKAKASDRYWYFSRLSVYDTRFVELINMLDKSCEGEIVNVLNKINNQGVTSFNLVKGTYVMDDKIELGFSNLSSGEILFLAAFAADRCKVHVFVNHYVQQLTRLSCALFFNMFGKSDFVDLVLDEEHVDYYGMLFKEAMV